MPELGIPLFSPHVILLRLSVTTPWPVPASVTLKVYVLAAASKVAVTESLALLTSNTHVPVPEQAPPQPPKV
ncbi:MAG: hypothetical protein WB630_23860, partial [Candidatus Acidiferrales bacterium]